LENLLILVTKDWPSSRIHDPGEELVNKRAQCTRTQGLHFLLIFSLCRPCVPCRHRNCLEIHSSTSSRLTIHVSFVFSCGEWSNIEDFDIGLITFSTTYPAFQHWDVGSKKFRKV
jgi:hypothetical protein